MGQTLIELKVFLNQKVDWNQTEIEDIQALIQDILSKAFGDEYVRIIGKSPVFDLAKVSEIIDFLSTKMHKC